MKTQTQIEFNEKQHTPAFAVLDRVRHFARSNLVGTITVTLASSLLLTGVSSWYMWNIYQGFRLTVTRKFEVQKRNQEILYLDEALTMSAQMAATTGSLKWQTRYDGFVPKLDLALKEILDNVPEKLRAEASKTDPAVAKLIDLEAQTFKLVQQGKSKEALQILEGEQYTTQKKIYADGNKQFSDLVAQYIQQELQSYQQQLLISMLLAGVTLPVLLASWLLVLSAVRDYIRDRQTAEIALEQSQISLLGLNQTLEIEARTRQNQEIQAISARDILEQDICELLDIVCEIESGDFTVQSKVNDRATGLISDTLNRLVEELGRVLSGVALNTERVVINSQRQGRIAATVAQRTSKQTESVIQVLALTETVRQSANSAAAQLITTNQSLVLLQTAVGQGEIAVGSLDREIDVLQKGSDLIVQQMKTLGEFVGLTDRFVYDQSDIATQTQVLALNASLVAARAAEQRDPKQFESVAREFESIANQVSQLAQQTNEGLTNLEQSSTQIHRVVSDVDGEVQRLGGLVNSFTQGVKQTREVFATMQSVTEQVVTAGELVSQTTQTIMASADSTVQSISEIATLSGQIDQQSQVARAISTQMSDLSTELLRNVQVFKLPGQETIAILPPTPAISNSELESNILIREKNYEFN